jgi:hypothetical protein
LTIKNMESKNGARSIEEAVKLFEEGLPDPGRTNIPAVFNHFTVDEKDVVLVAQRAKSSAGYTWRIEYPN